MTELPGAPTFAPPIDGVRTGGGRSAEPPRVIAVIGASGEPGTAGAALLRGVRATGAVYAVNPHYAGADLDGVPCVAGFAELPERPDLAVVAVPAYAVCGVAAACGRSGIPALTVIRAELTAEQHRRLLAVCRDHGMRLVDPESLAKAGVLQEDPA
ncbi:CoA-binding protein [Actinomadura monticuli]|uniref:CoA-binding protein n=1 Tax=Actinomadura monticuli TaxID=3097367 RepID=A0ABV4QFB5_9ACTN